MFLLALFTASKVSYEDLELPLFKYATIMAATKGFSRENLIGEGGFGPVYKVTFFIRMSGVFVESIYLSTLMLNVFLSRGTCLQTKK